MLINLSILVIHGQQILHTVLPVIFYTAFKTLTHIILSLNLTYFVLH
jgi:hypothetical protein